MCLLRLYHKIICIKEKPSKHQIEDSFLIRVRWKLYAFHICTMAKWYERYAISDLICTPDDGCKVLHNCRDSAFETEMKLCGCPLKMSIAEHWKHENRSIHYSNSGFLWNYFKWTDEVSIQEAHVKQETRSKTKRSDDQAISKTIKKQGFEIDTSF